jgi:PEP-CTERM motif
MKYYKIIVSMTVALSFLSLQTTKAQTIADWTFQTSASTNNIIGTGFTPGTTQSGILADIGTGTANASHAASTTAWSIPVGHGSANAWSANNWAVGDYYEFSVSTLSLAGIGVSFEQASSSTGPGSFTLQYSTDGASFTNFANYTVVAMSGANSWSNNVAGAGETASEYSYDLSSVTALDNQSAIYFRLLDNATTTPSGGTVAATGTDRVDDFTIGTVPEPSTMALAAVGGVACLLAMRRRR